MKRFLIFMYYENYPDGGAKDFKGSADTKDEIENIIRKSFNILINISNIRDTVDSICISFIDTQNDNVILNGIVGFNLNWITQSSIDEEKLTKVLDIIDNIINTDENKESKPHTRISIDSVNNGDKIIKIPTINMRDNDNIEKEISNHVKCDNHPTPCLCPPLQTQLYQILNDDNHITINVNGNDMRIKAELINVKITDDYIELL